jgi:hypothetical protein
MLHLPDPNPRLMQMMILPPAQLGGICKESRTATSATRNAHQTRNPAMHTAVACAMAFSMMLSMVAFATQNSFAPAVYARTLT